jgi:O-antigen/teichoic acid export membrane protein
VDLHLSGKAMRLEPSVLRGLSAEADGLGAPLPIVLEARPAAWWASKAVWAVLDQGVFAASNFALGVLLARWVSPEQFGSFAVAQSGFLLAGTFHSGLFSEPMLVFGSARHTRRFLAYFDILLHTHWRATGLASVVLACVAVVCWFLASPSLAGAFLGAALMTPFILFGWLVRRACFARMQPQWAATGGFLYLALLTAGTYILSLVDFLSAFSAFMLMGGSALISGSWILGQLRTASASVEAGPSRREVLQDHWSYGRWSLASSALSWVPGNLYYLVLPMFADVKAVGALKAVSNLVMPILHFNSALASLLLPALASAAKKKSHFNRLVAAGLAVLGGSSLLYWTMLATFRVPIVNAIYRGAYGDTAALVPIIALLPFGAACSDVLGAAVRALERPQQVFWAYIASASATVTLGIWAVAAWGQTGAAIGLLVSSCVTAVMCGLFLIGSGSRGGIAP